MVYGWTHRGFLFICFFVYLFFQMKSIEIHCTDFSCEYILYTFSNYLYCAGFLMLNLNKLAYPLYLCDSYKLQLMW